MSILRLILILIFLLLIIAFSIPIQVFCNIIGFKLKKIYPLYFYHLIDIESGEIHEFTNEEIEEIQRSVAKSLGYRLVDHRLELYGIKIKKDN